MPPRGARDRHADKTVRLMAQQKFGLPDQRPTAFIEGLDSYIDAYKKIKKDAFLEHRSLLRIIECDDDTFYDMSFEDILARHSLDEYKRVVMTTLDRDEDVVDEHTRGDNGLLNEKRQRAEGTIITGYTCCVEGNNTRRSVICMKASVGGVTDQNILSAMKIGALLHEIGHVDDIERGINWQYDNKLKWVDAEVYAHHYACKRMMESNYFVPLGQYIDGVRKMKDDGDKHARLGASRFLESAETQVYINKLNDVKSRMS